MFCGFLVFLRSGYSFPFRQKGNAEKSDVRHQL
jgi:hypothetical protein